MIPAAKAKSMSPYYPDLTERQAVVYEALVSWVEAHGYTPSLRDLMTLLGIASTNGLAIHLKPLVAKGYLEHVKRAGATVGGIYRPARLRFRRVESTQ